MSLTTVDMLSSALEREPEGPASGLGGRLGNGVTAGVFSCDAQGFIW